MSSELHTNELATVCFHILAEHLLASIHDSSWIEARAKTSEYEEHEVVSRLVKSGAEPSDLALFARLMQKEYLSNLCCVLDGAGLHGTPDLPFETFRIFSIDKKEKPEFLVDELHEVLSFCDLETEEEQSLRAAKGPDAYQDILRELQRRSAETSAYLDTTSGDDEPYTNEEIVGVGKDQLPERGRFCPDCQIYVPRFDALPDEQNELLGQGFKARFERATTATSCTRLWAEIWALHPLGKCNTKRCPKCGEFLRSKKATQCLSCGEKW